jgi:hypothetical protein
MQLREFGSLLGSLNPELRHNPAMPPVMPSSENKDDLIFLGTSAFTAAGWATVKAVRKNIE